MEKKALGQVKLLQACLVPLRHKQQVVVNKKENTPEIEKNDALYMRMNAWLSRHIHLCMLL
jgi:hypothetical protein